MGRGVILLGGLGRGGSFGGCCGGGRVSTYGLSCGGSGEHLSGLSAVAYVAEDDAGLCVGETFNV